MYINMYSIKKYEAICSIGNLSSVDLITVVPPVLLFYVHILKDGIY